MFVLPVVTLLEVSTAISNRHHLEFISIPDTMVDIIAVSTQNLARAQIADFFKENAPLTQGECDQEAQRRLAKSVHPAAVQGGTSYTVVSDDDTYVLQFRSNSSALDMQLITYAEQVYKGFTPRHKHLGVWCDLQLYEMGNVGDLDVSYPQKPTLWGPLPPTTNRLRFCQVRRHPYTPSSFFFLPPRS